MIQVIGLTKAYRRRRPPALVDLTFDARPGQITALLGPSGAGKSTALHLMLGLEKGRGTALFDGRPYRRIRRPEREIGALLDRPGRRLSHTVASGPAPDRGSGGYGSHGDSSHGGGSHGGGLRGAAATERLDRCPPPGHPGRRARNHLRLLAAAAGVPARRADQLLEQTRLAGAAEHRLRTFSPGMSRRLALAAALLGDPHTLLLDAPAQGLSPKNVEWFHAFLGAFATNGGTVLLTCTDPKEAAGLADRVVSLHSGVLLADQTVEEFVRTRLRDEVAVRGPQVGRLADLLVEQGAEVRRESGACISVSGVPRTEIGELAYRHGILLHELADRLVELGPEPPRRRRADWPGARRAAASDVVAIPAPPQAPSPGSSTPERAADAAPAEAPAAGGRPSTAGAAEAPDGPAAVRTATAVVDARPASRPGSGSVAVSASVSAAASETDPDQGPADFRRTGPRSRPVPGAASGATSLSGTVSGAVPGSVAAPTGRSTTDGADAAAGAPADVRPVDAADGDAGDDETVIVVAPGGSVSATVGRAGGGGGGGGADGIVAATTAADAVADGAEQQRSEAGE
ncbi:ATP-binding cassette domain-containing protein [Phaeacidiphilus oryzae]|uniref:ATP-binding cassette domain-containing protein n=1 Tax=Phaeacidiphilus oryzae TaxID=348818 RepID=UPI00068AD067|nr:ATP-binding cassette domain-containing protein [Phaeacidiphilus oryzae]